MGDTAPSCRLAVLLAAGCRKAIIFRHGPVKHTRLIAWDRATDTFEPGQWMKGTRVYDERSAISPDGEYLLLFLGTFRPPFQTYTVLSRPPYYTALALWPKGDTWGGGGTFAGDRDIVLDHFSKTLAPGFAWPSPFRVELADSGADALLARLKASREPPPSWQKRENEAAWTKRCVGDVCLMASERRVSQFLAQLEYALVYDTYNVSLAGARWADIDTNGDVLFAVGGALYRLHLDDVSHAMTKNDPLARSRLLADFSDMQFEPVMAPYSPARMVDDPAKFAPRLDRVTKEDRRRAKRERRAHL